MVREIEPLYLARAETPGSAAVGQVIMMQALAKILAGATRRRLCRHGDGNAEPKPVKRAHYGAVRRPNVTAHQDCQLTVVPAQVRAAGERQQRRDGEQHGRISLATWVHTHNLLGAVYLRTILPFHVMIVRSRLTAMAETYAAR